MRLCTGLYTQWPLFAGNRGARRIFLSTRTVAYPKDRWDVIWDYTLNREKVSTVPSLYSCVMVGTLYLLISVKQNSLSYYKRHDIPRMFILKETCINL